MSVRTRFDTWYTGDSLTILCFGRFFQGLQGSTISLLNLESWKSTISRQRKDGHTVSSRKKSSAQAHTMSTVLQLPPRASFSRVVRRLCLKGTCPSPCLSANTACQTTSQAISNNALELDWARVFGTSFNSWTFKRRDYHHSWVGGVDERIWGTCHLIILLSFPFVKTCTIIPTQKFICSSP